MALAFRGFVRLSCDDAKRVLSDVAPEKCFWVNKGPILHNVYELLNALKGMDDAKFAHHADKEKNDFANWADDVLKDNNLARRIRNAKTRQATANVIAKRIDALEKIVLQGR